MTSDTKPLYLYNTLTKTKELFAPFDADNVRLYVCGPTVYDYAHIGNARPAIIFDVLFRLLRHTYGAEHVTYVRNITDVDDKINARALRDFPDIELNDAIGQVTKTTELQYQHDMKALGCLDPSLQPRATEHIAEMIEMIEILIEKKHAYVSENHVLFDVKSFRSGNEVAYGKLSRRNLDELISGARIEVASYKRDPLDFVLWKPSTAREPGWPNPWNDNSEGGRPGWHIECSAMSKKYLGEKFDIHGGGIDLAFPHHENELAQSCCANDANQMAQIWMHNGFLQVEGEKMSKSLGNFITVNQLLATKEFGGRQWPGDVLRLAVLMTNYRDPIDFSLARLNEAEAILTKFKDRVGALGLSFSPAGEPDVEKAEPCSKFVAALRNDLNMSEAMAELHRHAKGTRLHNAQRIFASLKLLGVVTELSMQDWQAKAEYTNVDSADQDKIDTKIEARLAALEAKDWALADQIRDELKAEGIQLSDSKDTETGARVTTWEQVV